VSYLAFVGHFMPMWVTLTIMAFAQRRTGTYRPHDAKILSWEGAAFICARWPWVVLGTVAAIADAVAGRRTEFRVTPKGGGEAKDLPLSILAPYAAISLVSGIVAFAVRDLGIANGYYLLAVINAVTYGIVFTVILVAHWRENGIVRRGAPRFVRIGAAAALTLVPIAATGVHGLEMLDAVAWHSNLRFTETRFSVAGAGMGGEGLRKLSFRLHWIGDDAK
jgi:hypothetical protein